MPDLPVFRMPTCTRRAHFFGGHRWWCKGCRTEAEQQFRDVCEAFWAMKLEDKDA